MTLSNLEADVTSVSRDIAVCPFLTARRSLGFKEIIRNELRLNNFFELRPRMLQRNARS